MKRTSRKANRERGTAFVSILTVIGLLGLTAGGAMLATGDIILDTAKTGDESMHASRLGNERNKPSSAFHTGGNPEDIGEAEVPSAPGDSALDPDSPSLSPNGDALAPPNTGANPDDAPSKGTSPWVTLVVDPNDVPFEVENPTGGDWAFERGLTPEPLSEDPNPTGDAPGAAGDAPEDEDRSFLGALWNVSSKWAWFQVKPKTMEEQIAHDTAAGGVILDAGASLVSGIWNGAKAGAIGAFDYTFDPEYRSEVNDAVVETAGNIVDGAAQVIDDPGAALDAAGTWIVETGEDIAVAVNDSVQDASRTLDNCEGVDCATKLGEITGGATVIGAEVVISVYGGAAISAVAKGSKIIRAGDLIEDAIPPRAVLIGEGGASIAVRQGDDVIKTIKSDFGTTGAWKLNAAQRAEVAEHTVRNQNMLAREIDVVPSASIDGPGVIRLPFKDGQSFDDLNGPARANAKEQMEVLAVRAEEVIPPSKTDPLEWGDDYEPFVDRNPDNFRFDNDGNVTAWFDPVAVAPPRSALKSEIAAAAGNDVTRVAPGTTVRNADEIPSDWMDDVTRPAPTVRNSDPIPSDWMDDVTRPAPTLPAGGARGPPMAGSDVTRVAPVEGVTRIQPVQAGPKYTKTATLDRHYAGEEVTGNRIWQGSKVDYLSESGRKPYLVTVRDGKMYDAEGSPLDTGGGRTAHGQQDAGIYVMDTDGNIYVSKDHKVGEFHHSSLLAGKDVAAAGEIRVVNGEVQFVNRGSGHYRPNQEHLGQMMSELGDRGIDVKKVDVGGF